MSDRKKAILAKNSYVTDDKFWTLSTPDSQNIETNQPVFDRMLLLKALTASQPMCGYTVNCCSGFGKTNTAGSSGYAWRQTGILQQPGPNQPSPLPGFSPKENRHWLFVTFRFWEQNRCSLKFDFFKLLLQQIAHLEFLDSHESSTARLFGCIRKMYPEEIHASCISYTQHRRPCCGNVKSESLLSMK